MKEQLRDNSTSNCCSCADSHSCLESKHHRSWQNWQFCWGTTVRCDSAALKYASFVIVPFNHNKNPVPSGWPLLPLPKSLLNESQMKSDNRRFYCLPRINAANLLHLLCWCFFLLAYLMLLAQCVSVVLLHFTSCLTSKCSCGLENHSSEWKLVAPHKQVAKLSLIIHKQRTV